MNRVVVETAVVATAQAQQEVGSGVAELVVGPLVATAALLEPCLVGAAEALVAGSMETAKAPLVLAVMVVGESAVVGKVEVAMEEGTAEVQSGLVAACWGNVLGWLVGSPAKESMVGVQAVAKVMEVEAMGVVATGVVARGVAATEMGLMEMEQVEGGADSALWQGPVEDRQEGVAAMGG